MDTQGLLQELLDLAERLGIEVRQVDLGGQAGGLCRIREKEVLYVDSSTLAADQLAAAAEALAGRDGLEEQYLLPQVRQILTDYRKTF